jgi:hypothetical protein
MDQETPDQEKSALFSMIYALKVPGLKAYIAAITYLGLPAKPADALSVFAQQQRLSSRRTAAIGSLVWLAFIGWLLFDGWTNGAYTFWLIYWVIAGIFALGTLASIVVGLFRLPGNTHGQRDANQKRTWDDLRTTRDALLSQGLPSAELTSSGTTPAEMTSPRIMRTLRPERRYRKNAVSGLLISLIFSTFYISGFVILGHVLNDPFSSFDVFAPLIGLFVAMETFTLYRFISELAAWRPQLVAMDSDGLNWHTPWGCERSVSWAEARALAKIEMPSTPGYTGELTSGTMYLLVGQHTSLTWYAPLHGKYTESAEELAQLVYARTTLALQDCTAAIRAFARAQGTARKQLGQTKTAAVPPPRRSVRLAPNLGYMVVLVTVLSGILLPFVRQQTYAAQLEQIESQQPIARDPLTSNMLGWDDSDDYHFTPDGYVSTGTTCCGYLNTRAGIVGGGFLEVTVRSNLKAAWDDVGLVFRADTTSGPLPTFSIPPNGEWEFSYYTINSNGGLDFGNIVRTEGFPFGVPAIHRGANAVNRLGVLMRGTTYTFFINGQYVGTTKADTLPLSGRVGLYADSYQGSATFTDFALYPA